MRILLADCFTRKAFDVYNILRKEYGKECVIPASDRPDYLKALGIFGKQSMQLRAHSDDVFAEDLLALSRCYEDEKIVFLPIEERVVLLFYNFIETHGCMNFAYMLPELPVFSLSRDKLELNRFCQNKAIPCPRLYEPDNISSMSDLPHPLIVKPRHGSGSEGFLFVDDADGLSALREVPLHDYVIQERLPDGRDVKGAFFLCDHGKIIASYTHQRLRTYPVDGGVTVYSRFDVDEKAIEAAARVLQELNWTGLAMVELLWDKRDKSYKVIEINPRLWGSILLDQFSGAFLLKNYVELSLGRAPVRQELKQDSKIRWLFPFELMNLILAKGQIPEFWHFGRQTCLINISYSSFLRSLMFHLFYYLKAENYKKFLSKWLR
ncbi:ATP-grasp domain-containing protein [Prosthecochloris sp. HL-130-GSB]|uniref:ATP-grasp domain-containing protein n=1 Tax=Prosthecochloris sp. HL-130-GSB TaxID=1974213 RepID=UPI000A1C15E2|nr:ATP-grasp domain-containing protein [Prosthecochloris sp. HL-130-GSB]ARM31349.1 hypothetical protein B9H02_08670 [Prosthecochloris sp. HL-130-GSB]